MVKEFNLQDHKTKALNIADAVGQSEQLCKQCKEPIEKGFRFCSGECKQYYYR